MEGSDQVESGAWSRARRCTEAHAADDECVARSLEAVPAANLFDQAFQGRVLKLDHLAALLAEQVFVLGIAVVVLVEHARPDLQAAEQAGIHELVSVGKRWPD